MIVFADKLQAKFDEDKFVCVGLDSDVGKIDMESLGHDNPEALLLAQDHYLRLQNAEPDEEVPPLTSEERKLLAEAQLIFNKRIVDATYDTACAYKLNVAFYEALGDWGIRTLAETIAYIHEIAPDVVIILDAKRGDIGNTNNGYVQFAFNYLGADAITVHPYLGEEALRPFLDRADKGVIVLARTSNTGAGEFQDLVVHHHCRSDSANLVVPLYKGLARAVARDWNYNGNCAVVAGATYPDELAEIRDIVGDLAMLIPGIGSQGGDLKATLKAGADSRNQGMIINNSRAIIFADDPRAAALKMHEAINAILPLVPFMRIADLLFKVGAVQFGAFKLKLHETQPDAPLSPIYLNLRTYMNPKPGPLDHGSIRAIAKLLYKLVRSTPDLDFQYLAGIPNAGEPLADALMERLGPDSGVTQLRLVKEESEGGRRIAGLEVGNWGKPGKVLLVDDLITQADSKLEAIAVLEEYGFEVRDLLVLVDREQGGSDHLRSEEGVRTIAAFTLSQLLDYYVEESKIETEKADEVRTYVAASRV